MLINLTNHRFENWSAEQRVEAERIYEIVNDNIPFPLIDPAWSKEQVAQLASEYIRKCKDVLGNGTHNAIHIMGELTFVYYFVSMAHKLGVKCIASTTNRVVQTKKQVNNDGIEQEVKTAIFQFVRFREY